MVWLIPFLSSDSAWVQMLMTELQADDRAHDQVWGESIDVRERGGDEWKGTHARDII